MSIESLNADHFQGGANLSNLSTDPADSLVKKLNEVIEQINDVEEVAGLGDNIDDAQAQFTDAEEIDAMIAVLAAGQGTVGMAGLHRVRCMITTNVANVSAFTVASRDGLTLVEGDRVYLNGQTTAEQNGPYRVGAVSVGSAALTRCVDWAAGAVIPTGTLVAVDAGTVNGNKLFMLTNTGDVTVASTAPTVAPLQVGFVPAKYPKTVADAAAADETDETPFHVNDTGVTRAVTAVNFQPGAALTADNSDFGTLSVYRRDADGTNQTLVAEISTEITGSGNWTAFVAVPLTLSVTLANTLLAPGQQLTFEITKDGNGVTIPVGALVASLG